MITDVQNERCELSDEELCAVAGGGYIPQRIGFGADTDFRIAQKQLMDSNFRGVIVAPVLP